MPESLLVPEPELTLLPVLESPPVPVLPGPPGPLLAAPEALRWQCRVVMGLSPTLLVPAMLVGVQKRPRLLTSPWNETLGYDLVFDEKPRESKRATAPGAAIGPDKVLGKGVGPQFMWTICSCSSGTDRSPTLNPR